MDEVEKNAVLVVAWEPIEGCHPVPVDILGSSGEDDSRHESATQVQKDKIEAQLKQTNKRDRSELIP
eukprot:scaffold1434_cov107-Cylindrotheca_fusiformis.AAC.11